MKRKILSCLTALAICLSFAVFAAAQDDDRVASAVGDMYVISAKAGGVNYVEGKVAVVKNTRSGYLVKGDKLEVGDKVSTGANGKAEILLNPGSFVRLGANAVFEFASTSLDDVKIKLTGGSAIFEVFADNEFKVAIATPKANFYAIKSGVYRVDILPDGSGKISVWKGRAQIGEDTEVVVKAGRAAVVNGNKVAIKAGWAAVVNGNKVAIEKFDRDDKDTLENWSKDRAKTLAKINSRLQRDNLRGSLLNTFNRNGWGLYDSFGLWVFDRFSGYYCFLPFGYGWSSPYGYWYNRNLWYFRMPRYVYYSQPSQPVNNGNTNSPSAGIVRRNTVKTPPFERVQPTITTRSTVKTDDSSPMMRPSAPATTMPSVIVPRTSTKGRDN